MKFLTQNCPFVHDRDFRGIVLSSSSVSTFGDLSTLFTSSALSAGEEHSKSSSAFEVEHRFYYTQDDFTTKEEDREACYGNWGRKNACFRYSLFFAQLHLPKASVFVIALPLMKMARKVYPLLEERSRGRDIMFWRADLRSLIQQFKAGENLEGRMALRTIRYAVFGDNKASRFMVSGSDTASSTTLRQVEDALTRKGIRYSPRVAELCFSDQKVGYRFYLTLSRLGHIKFFISEGTEHFPTLGMILAHLMKLKLFERGPFPSFTWPDDEESNDE